MAKKTIYERFVRSKSVIEVLGENFVLTQEHKNELDAWNKHYDFRLSGGWHKQMARWAQRKISGWVKRRHLLEKNGAISNSLNNYIIRYGEEEGTHLYQNRVASLPKLTDFFEKEALKLGITLADVRKRYGKSAYQTRVKNGNATNVDLWKARGLSDTEIKAKVKKASTRDLAFYQRKYGEVDGLTKFEATKQKRRDTWSTKDRRTHALATLPKTFNKDGQEYAALTGFIEQNNLSAYRCQLGAPKDQFYQWIPNVGYRRYDLAVWDSDRLLYVVEFHGIFHINFSDFKEELRHLPFVSNGKVLTHAPTYGASYDNDMNKRNHILTKYPTTKYIVIWPKHLKNGTLTINDLISI